MAIQPKSGISVSPDHGTRGTQTITFFATTNYGRNQRTAQFTFSTTASGYQSNQQVQRTVTVNQAGHVEYVEFGSGGFTSTGSIVAVPDSSSSTIEIQGYSNSKQLSVACPSGNDGLSNFVKKYSTNDGSTWSDFTDGQDITGDPGATNRYKWKVQFTVAENTTIEERTWIVKVKPKTNGMQEATYTLTQYAGLPSLTVDDSTITLDYEGNAQTTTLRTNSPWEAS